MMINYTLYKREMKGSWKMLLIFAAILTLYVSMIIGMYDPSMASIFEQFAQTMPEIMAAVGMSGSASTVNGFVAANLYGMILLAFPMVYIILRANGLIARYVDRGSMVALVAAPIRRKTVALTQIGVLVTGIFALVLFATLLEIVCIAASFPDELKVGELLALNGGLLCLHLFIGGICFLASCAFDDAKRSVAFGAGIPALMFVLQMLANTGGAAENVKYATFFTLFDSAGILAGEARAIIGIFILLAGAIALYAASVAVFRKKDLHI